MLGNFSFGDYFKEDAIRFAWELLTDREKGYGLEPERLWATVFLTDDDAAKIWETLSAGGTHPALRRESRTSGRWGRRGPAVRAPRSTTSAGRSLAEHACARQRPGGRDRRDLEPRVHAVRARRLREARAAAAAVGRHGRRARAHRRRPPGGRTTTSTPTSSRPIIGEIERVSGRSYVGGMADEDAPFRVVADHARSVTMLMADGVMPSNEGRGYVLRRIIRRATALRAAARDRGARFSTRSRPRRRRPSRASTSTPDEAALASSNRIGPPLRAEEERFASTLSAGEALVSEAIERLRRSGERTLPGDGPFRLYDTHGIPVDVIEEIARDEGLHGRPRGLRGRDGGAARALARRPRSSMRRTCPSTTGSTCPPATRSSGDIPSTTSFLSTGRAIVGLVKDGAPSARLAAGETGEAVADRTVFYPEGGGQVADTGTWTWPEGEAEVLHVWRPRPETIAHRIRVTRGALARGTAVNMRVPEWVRRRTQANHTGTHLLHAALRKVLGQERGRWARSSRRTGCASTTRRAAPPTPGADRRDREPRQRGDPARSRGDEVEPAHGRGAPPRRRHVLLGQVLRLRPGRRGAGLFDRALRRLPRSPDRRDRRLQDRLGQVAGVRRPAARGRDVARRRRSPARRRGDAEPARGGGAVAARGPARAVGRARGALEGRSSASSRP